MSEQTGMPVSFEEDEEMANFIQMLRHQHAVYTKLTGALFDYLTDLSAGLDRARGERSQPMLMLSEDEQFFIGQIDNVVEFLRKMGCNDALPNMYCKSCDTKYFISDADVHGADRDQFDRSKLMIDHCLNCVTRQPLYFIGAENVSVENDENGPAYGRD
jgi:hypothetical protein